MKCSQRGIELIKQYERCRLKAYNDGFGFWTCGWGHTAGVTKDTIFTPEQADEVFTSDLADVENSVNGLLKTNVTQGQFDALCSFEFNLGCGALKYSTLLADLNAGFADKAAQEFPHWCHVGTRVVAGLVLRRAAEQKLFKGEL